MSFETTLVDKPTSGPVAQWHPPSGSLTANYGQLEGFQIIAFAQTEAVYSEVAEHVRELARLHRGWDGHDGLPATPQAISRALTFLMQLEAASSGLVPPPLVGPLPDGGVALVWRLQQQEVEVLFREDGTVEYTVSDRDGVQPPVYRDGVSFPDLLAVIPQHVIA